jgi:RNA polymerase sigma-70 factor (ECF subfamily)
LDFLGGVFRKFVVCIYLDFGFHYFHAPEPMPDSKRDDAMLPAAGIARSEGSAPDFVSLFLAHQWRIHRYIVTLLSSQQDAEDLVQETAAVLWQKFGEFQSGTNFFAWSCKTAYLLVLEHRRKKSRGIALLDNEVLEQLAIFAASDDSSPEIRLSALDQCLSKLPPRDRELIDQCYAVNVKVREVAAERERSAKSVRKSLGRIRRALLECVRRKLAVAEREGGCL